MRWSYLFLNIMITVSWSPIYACVSKVLKEVFNSNPTMEGVTLSGFMMLIIVFFYMLFFFILFYMATLFYAIIPVVVYTSVFLVLRWVKLPVVLSKIILVMTMLGCILITFYVITDFGKQEAFLIRSYCMIGVLSGLLLKLEERGVESTFKVGL